MLARVAERRDWRVFAWVLLDNHFHIFLRTPQADLSAGMHDLNAGYVSTFNRRHRRVGPLFQGRFKGVLVEEGYHYWELTRYIHLNPVRARLVEEPEGYQWGSCRGYFHSRLAPEWLAWEEVLQEHGRTVRSARRRYREFLREGISSPVQSPFKATVASTLLGSSSFVDRMKVWLHDRLPDAEVPAARELRRQIAPAQVVAAVCEVYGTSEDTLRARGRRGNEPRAVALYLCKRLTRVCLSELGQTFGGVGASAVCNAVSALDHRLQRDRRVARLVSQIEKHLS